MEPILSGAYALMDRLLPFAFAEPAFMKRALLALLLTAPAAAAIFRRVAEVEVEHEKRYLRLLGHVKNGTLYKREKPIRWKCTKCGRIHEGTEAPERCATCGHPQGWFVPVEANY